MPTVMEKPSSPETQPEASNGKMDKDLRSCPFHKSPVESPQEKTTNGTSPSHSRFLKSEPDTDDCGSTPKENLSLTESSFEYSPVNGSVSPVEKESKEDDDLVKDGVKSNVKLDDVVVVTECGSSESKEKKESKNEFAPLSLKLLLPGHTEAIDIIHVAKDTVNDLLQYSFERPDCCYKTCLSIRLNGKKLDNFAELGSVEELRNGSTIELIEEPYTLRDVLIHIQRLQELLGPNLLQPSFTCTNGLSLSFLSSLVKDSLENSGDAKTDQPFPLPPDDILASKDVPLSLSSFYPNNINETLQVPECLKNLSFSVWNPPPPNRKFKGDILYLDIKTMEGEDFCVTACPTGFYLNKCVLNVTFDPSPRKVAHHCQHLVTLLQQISALFRKNYSLLQKHAEKKNGYEVFPVPYPVYPWVVPKTEAKPVVFRTDETMGLKVHTDELLVGQLRDWNEEMQTAKELPTSTLQHRFFRDRALFKVHSDFVQAAVRGAKAAVDGQLHPLNPADQEKHQMYLWNNIFFSTGFDGRGHFKEFGGDEAGHAAANYDLQGVEIVDALNVKGLYTLGAVLIDYRGYRVFAQTIVPGLLQREHESSIVYGTMDNGKTFNGNDKFQELLRDCGEKLHHRTHKVLTESKKEVELPMSLEVKGIEGTDGRHYILDLFRILPPDINYVDASLLGTSDTAAAVTNVFRHKLYILRPELVDGFLRMSRRVALELHMFQKMKKSFAGAQPTTTPTNNSSGTIEAVEKIEPKLEVSDLEKLAKDSFIANTTDPSLVLLSNVQEKGPIDTSDLTKLLLVDSELEIDKPVEQEVEPVQQVKLVKQDSATGTSTQDTTATLEESTKEVSSTTIDPSLNGDLIDLQDIDFKFNPDIFAPGIHHAEPPEELEQDRKLVTEIACYLSDTVIPKFIGDCIILQVSPLDGSALKTQLHTRGINLRYLGKIATLAKTREDLSHLHRICVSEMILRTARRRFRKVLLNTPLHRNVAAVAHILNCLFTDIEENINDENSVTKKKSKRKRANKDTATKATPNNKDLSFTSLTQGKLWKIILDDITSHYHFNIEHNSLTEVCTNLTLNKLTLLREFCLKTGIQIITKEYKFSSTTPFHEDDISNLVPVVKYTGFKPTEASSLFNLAQVRLQSGNAKIAREYLMEAVQLYSQVYGPLHSDIGNCYRIIARIHHALGENNMSVQYQYKAVLIFERVYGVDHFCTISSYFLLAQYCCAAGKNESALILLYRTRYLVMLVHGFDNPDLANIDFYIGLILGNCGYHEKSVEFLENTLKLQNKFYGESSITIATTHHLVANSLTHLGSFSEAKHHERKAYTIYRTKLGPDHSRTVESYKDIRYITEKHVSYDQTVELAQGLPTAGRVGGKSNKYKSHKHD